MIHPRTGDLVAVESEGRYYYALILDKIKLFGGNWVFVFPFSSAKALPADEVLRRSGEGWHAFVDFIWAKREKRISRVARGVDVSRFSGPGIVKSSNAFPRAATRWFLKDLSTGRITQKPALNAEEQSLPMSERIDDTTMVQRVNQGWSPSKEYRRQMAL